MTEQSRRTGSSTEPLEALRSSATLVASGVAKRYGAVRALEHADISIKAGEVVALLGANGSGKSTLGRVLTGMTRPDSGSLTLRGAPLHLTSPVQARRLGITAVYQELSLVPDMTVAENVWLGHEPTRLGGVDRRALLERTAELLTNFRGVFTEDVEPNTIVGGLPNSERQLVEVVKALAWEPSVLILDEATASLDSRQVERLFELVHEWRDQGMALAFISHRMDEIFQVADRAVVLRNGSTVGELPIKEATEGKLVQLMTGGGTVAEVALARAPALNEHETLDALGSKTLELRGYGGTTVAPLDLTVRRGELVGIGGLQGQGQRQLLLALFGAVPHVGDLFVNGVPARFGSPRHAMNAGLAYVPGDRNKEGLLAIRSILENMQLASWSEYGTVLDMKRARSDAERTAKDLAIKFAHLDEPVSNLSGGNAQKVVIGKWLLRQPTVLLLDDPTKGVDVQAKAEFYRLLERLQEQGTAILFYSSDDAELLALCRRVLVMQDGRVTATLEGDTLTSDHLVAAAMGTTGGAPA